jgi:hypothetical protein
MTASRVTVRRKIPWYAWLLGFVAISAALAGYSWWMFDIGMRAAGVDLSAMRTELTSLRTKTAQLSKVNEDLMTRAGRAEGQHQVEKATHDDLAKQVKALMNENAQLKEDLAFFHAVTSGDAKQEKITVHRLQLQRDQGLGEFRYGLLLVQAGGAGKSFQGRLQFTVRLRQNGKESVMTLPGPAAGSPDPFRVEFRFYKRVEGTFKAPVAATVESLQVRVFTDGSREPLASESVQLS